MMERYLEKKLLLLRNVAMLYQLQRLYSVDSDMMKCNNLESASIA
jgi:hypothetical protein